MLDHILCCKRGCCSLGHYYFATIGHGWPLNYHFIYDVVAVMVVIFILISFALPKSTEKKRLPDPVKPQATNIHYPTKNK